LWTCRTEFNKFAINPNKLKNAAYDYWAIINTWPIPNKDKAKVKSQLVAASRQVVSLLKNRLELPTQENIEQVLAIYDIDMLPNSPSYSDFIKGVTHLFNKTADDTGTLDFDDMLFFPWYYDIQPPQFDFVLADEIQDFNAAQINLVLKAVGERSAGVGDERQSIYGFRGAMLNSMEEFAKTLDCKPYPLSMTFRVPKIGVNRINSNFPEIDFEGWEGAAEGEIENTCLDAFLSQVQDGDLVICRNNAPLVQPVYSLIRQGKKASIVGGNVGQGIKGLFERAEGVEERSTIGRGLTVVLGELNKQKQYYEKQEKWGKVAGIQDKMDTITDLADGCILVRDLYKRINLIFTDELAGISFSTVHKAKGLEANNVGILYPDLMPSSYASQDWEMQQERNIQYVAETRFKQRMSLIND
jgi:superfamily I DNA/RNA helicase